MTENCHFFKMHLYFKTEIYQPRFKTKANPLYSLYTFILVISQSSRHFPQNFVKIQRINSVSRIHQTLSSLLTVK